jgi:sarcosine oxidase
VLGLERADVPTTTGSSGGVNRIIRLAYNEDPRYVPLLRRAYERWRALEERWGRQLLVITGGLDIGPPGSAVPEGAIEACRVHDLPHEVLDGRETRARYPGLAIPDHHVDWEPEDDGVVVRTERAEYRASRLVLTAGAWMRRLAAPLRDLAIPERQVLVWLAARRPELFRVGALPVFILEEESGAEWYVFPEYGIPGVKVGLYHHRGETIDPDTTDWRVLEPEDERIMREGVARFMPDANGPLLSWRACIFTNTPDEHFILDRYPGYPQVILASPCSGHGYKFASVIGEVLADMAMDRHPRFDLSMFRLDRFAAA